MVRGRLVAGKAGAEILDRAAIAVLVRTVTLNTGQLPGWCIHIVHQPRILMTVSTVT